MQEQIFSDRDMPEQTYGFTVVPGTGQDGSALQQKLCAIQGSGTPRYRYFRAGCGCRLKGWPSSVLEQAIAQSGYQVTGCTDGSAARRRSFFDRILEKSGIILYNKKA